MTSELVRLKALILYFLKIKIFNISGHFRPICDALNIEKSVIFCSILANIDDLHIYDRKSAIYTYMSNIFS